MYAIPGGLIAVGTKVDPQFTRSDNMVGQIIGHPGKMPEVFIEIDVQTTFLKRIVGTKEDNTRIENIRTDETLLINIGSTSCGGNVVSVRDVSIWKISLIIVVLELCKNLADEACVCKYERKDCTQQKDRPQLQTYWMGSDY